MLLFRSIILVRSIILDSIRRLWYGTPLCLLALGRGPSHRYGVMHCVVDLAQSFHGQVEVRGRGGTLDVLWSTSADYGDVDGRVRERPGHGDRKSTRLNSSHTVISYAVFCLKKKKTRNRNKTLLMSITSWRYGIPS